MLDIISMTTLLIIMIFTAILLFLIVLGGKLQESDYERYLEDKEQMAYIKDYQMKKQDKKNKSYLWRNLWKKKNIHGNK